MHKRWVVAMSAMAQLACCIARGAKVKTPRGEVSIEDVVVGDEVIVVDPQTLEQHVGRVTAVRSAMREAGRLDGLTLTSAHPLFDPEKYEWAPAGDWLLGVRATVQTMNGPRRVARTERFAGVEEVFDLSVDHPLHTFVADGVVVHNKRYPITRPPCAGPDGGYVSPVDERCVCPHPDESSAFECPFDGGVATCACSSDITFFSDWRTASGRTGDAVTDGAKWTHVPCAADAGVEAVPVEIKTSASRAALRVAPGACGVVEVQREARAGEVMLNVSGSVSAPTPLVMVDDLVLIGLAPDADGGVRLFTGSTSTPAIATDAIAPNQWHVVSWSVDVNATQAQIYPRVGGITPDLTAAQFSAPSASMSLTEWYATGGGFPVSAAPTRLRLGVSSPSEVEVLFSGFTLKPR